MTASAASWFAVSVTVPPEYTEAAEFAFNELDSLGSEVDLLTKTNSGLCTVTAYFTARPDDEAITFHLQTAAEIYGLSPEIDFVVRHSKVNDQDWLAEWKKYWKPTVLGRFVIAAPWHDVDDTDKIVIRIEPNMAFGTGTHETTQLCLEAIGNHYRPGQSFLDVGTGTGILAIAAAKMALGDETFFAVDTDADAVEIARTNADLNGVSEKIEFAAGAIDATTAHYDFVCANLTADVILPILPLLIEKTNHILVLSGILAEQEKMVVDQIPADLHRSVERSGEWISVTIIKF